MNTPPEFEGFTFVADDVYELGERMEMLPVYRFDRFADAIEATDRDKRVEFALVPGGDFRSGFAQETIDAWREFFDESVSLDVRSEDHHVEPFLIARTPLTQSVLDATFPELEFVDQRNAEGPDVPVHGISWQTSNEVAEKLGLELPTSAEWEYACRADSDAIFHFGPTELTAREYGWFDTVSPMGVGQKRPNAWGLHDMTGNVWEWCQDEWIETLDDEDDPERSAAWSVPLKMFRGGAWNVKNVLALASSFSSGAGSQYTGPDVGVRFVFRTSL